MEGESIDIEKGYSRWQVYYLVMTWHCKHQAYSDWHDKKSDAVKHNESFRAMALYDGYHHSDAY